MKRILFSLLILLAATALKAQDTATAIPPYEYAFVYYYRDTSFKHYVAIYYEDDTFEKFAWMPENKISAVSVMSGNPYPKGFAVYIKAFHALESKGYELITSDASMGEGSIPYYIFRRRKKQ